MAPRAGPTNPNQVWAEAERAVPCRTLGSRRTALKALERIRPKSPMDWILEAQLATAEGHPDQALAAIDRIPTTTRSPPRPICSQAGSSGNAIA